MSVFALVQNGSSIELAELPPHWPREVGTTFVHTSRRLGKGTWTIIRDFKMQQAHQINCLVQLLGLDAVSQLFEADILETVPV